MRDEGFDVRETFCDFVAARGRSSAVRLLSGTRVDDEDLDASDGNAEVLVVVERAGFLVAAVATGTPPPSALAFRWLSSVLVAAGDCFVAIVVFLADAALMPVVVFLAELVPVLAMAVLAGVALFATAVLPIDWVRFGAAAFPVSFAPFVVATRLPDTVFAMDAFLATDALPVTEGFRTPGVSFAVAGFFAVTPFFAAPFLAVEIFFAAPRLPAAVELGAVLAMVVFFARATFFATAAFLPVAVFAAPDVFFATAPFRTVFLAATRLPVVAPVRTGDRPFDVRLVVAIITSSLRGRDVRCLEG